MKKVLFALLMLAGTASAAVTSLTPITPQITDNDCKIAYNSSQANKSCKNAYQASRGTVAQPTCYVAADCQKKDGSWKSNVTEVLYKDVSKLHNCDGNLVTYMC